MPVVLVTVGDQRYSKSVKHSFSWQYSRTSYVKDVK